MEAQRSSEPETSETNDVEIGDSHSPPTEDLEAELLTAIEKQYAPQKDVPRRIHILGTGSIGKLVAHSLRGIAKPPPMTLIFHRYKLLEAWENGKKQVTVHDNGYDVPRGGFDVELMREKRREHGVEVEEGQPSVYDVADGSGGAEVRPHEAAEALKEMQAQRQDAQEDSANDSTQSTLTRKESSPRRGDYAVSDEPIHNLIVTTKAAVTVAALSALRHRILPTSTICFLQNGMGIVDEVNKQLFPKAEDRPNYMQGIITHGANVPPEKAVHDPFYAVHAGHGTIAIGLLPRDDSKSTTSSGDEKDIQPEKFPTNARYLLRTLTRCPVLCAVGFTPMELLQQQLEKLVMNCTINPLTVLLDARNGSILYNFAITRTMRLMIAEISHVILNLPELRGIPNVPNRFNTARLETLVVSMANRSKDNISSMLADVRAGRKTEIEYINGYIVRRGEEVGIKCVVNYAIMQTVIGKAAMMEREMRDSVPSEEENKRKLAGD